MKLAREEPLTGIRQLRQETEQQDPEVGRVRRLHRGQPGQRIWGWRACAYGRCSFWWAADVTKLELAGRVADRLHLTKRQMEAVVNILLTCITEALREGDRVELRGFGSFRARSRNARKERNPRTGDAVRVASKRVPFFKAGKNLREKVEPADPVNNQPVTERPNLPRRQRRGFQS